MPGRRTAICAAALAVALAEGCTTQARDRSSARTATPSTPTPAARRLTQADVEMVVAVRQAKAAGDRRAREALRERGRQLALGMPLPASPPPEGADPAASGRRLPASAPHPAGEDAAAAIGVDAAAYRRARGRIDEVVARRESLREQDAVDCLRAAQLDGLRRARAAAATDEDRARLDPVIAELAASARRDRAALAEAAATVSDAEVDLVDRHAAALGLAPRLAPAPAASEPAGNPDGAERPGEAEAAGDTAAGDAPAGPAPSPP